MTAPVPEAIESHNLDATDDTTSEPVPLLDAPRADSPRDPIDKGDVDSETEHDSRGHRRSSWNLGGIPVPSIGFVGFAVALIASAFVFFQLRPDLLFADTTPSGGDMGAHVWGPAFMRDSLLTQGRLTGWTPDWYAGFPAYHFYMVAPPLAILAVNAGLAPFFGIPIAIGLLAAAWWFTRRSTAHRPLLWTIAGLAAVLVVPLPYGISFKLVSVAGLVLFPIAGWALGRLARCPEPVPAFLALGSLLFLFDTNFTIYGGNIASTLAGEFAFSLSLCLTLVALGLSIRAMDDDNKRTSAAILIALVALSHLIPLFFLMAGLAISMLLHDRIPRAWVAAAGITLALIPIGTKEGSGLLTALASIASFGIVLAAVLIADSEVQRRARWLVAVGPIAALTSAFWLLPFYLRSDYFNDMGWERLDEVGPALLTTPMKVLLPIAVIGGVLAFATRDRIGMLFSVMALASASGVANLPEGKLWNARLLPFYYLSVYLLAAVGVALVVRFSAAAVSERLDQPDRRLMIGAPALGLLVALVAVAMPLRALPLATNDADGSYSWLGIRTAEASFIPSWVSWNYSGYEEKRSFREYRDIVATMGTVGEEVGCGRAMWEYEKELDRYGTPMALMLLPHWTDGCIGSMEGLYFESSATTPFHFLHQSTLSISPSRAQRDLPYQGFNLETGVSQLQVMGVRYYMAQTDEATAAAMENPDLTLVATSQPWSVFEVAGTELVEALAFEPVVATGPTEEQIGELATRFDVGWLSQAVAFYNDPIQFQAMPAEDGPETWDRVEYLTAGTGRSIEPVAVTNVAQGTDSIRFTVDQVGQPVLVKTSYFPNWQADGADGPWQIGPNMMVVVPTGTDVELTYGYTLAEYVGYGLALLGLIGIAGLYRYDRRSRVD